MMRQVHRNVVLGLGILAAATHPNAVWASLAETVTFDIAPQTLQEALIRYSSLAQVQVTGSADLIDGRRSTGVNGALPARQALTRLLEGTQLTYDVIDTNTVIIKSLEPNAALQSGALTPSPTQSHLNLSQADAPLSGPVGHGEQAKGGDERNDVLAEVIVTAQKREERLQDVPVPVTVLSGEVLTQTNQLHLQDYYSKVPGLNLQVGGDGDTVFISIRGVTNGGGGAPTVGFVVDDVSYGSAAGASAGGPPDIDPGDLARVEVLRGPQGTLYGANSMGGLLKFVTVDPSTQGFSGRIQAGTSSFFNGVSPGYNFRGSLNVPVNETMALRASAFREQNPGYIENIQTGQRGVNRQTSDGGRISALWKPSDVWSLKLSALIQDVKRDGTDVAVDGPGFGDLQARSLPQTQTFEHKTQAYSANLKANFNGVDFTSLTGYNIDQLSLVHDLTLLGGGYYSQQSSALLGVSGSVELASQTTHRFSQELRVSLPLTDRLNWLLGAYYADESNNIPASYAGANPATGALKGGYIYAQLNKLSYKEYAAFTDFTYTFNDSFDIQVGGRESKYDQTFDALRYGPLAATFFCPTAAPCPELVISDLRSQGTSFTYLVTPRYKISPDLMVYTRFASGYRPGGANITCSPGVPCQYGPEKTQNYEVGFKGSLLDHVLSVDASLYRIDWTDIQTGFAAPPPSTLGYTANAGSARSQGVELSLEARPVQGLTLSTWVTWDDAVFKGTLPAAAGEGARRDGDRLPYSSRFSGNLAFDEEFALRGPLSAFVGATLSYVGDRQGAVQRHPTAGNPNPSPRADFPAYAQTDAHAGLKYDDWTFTAFVNNLTDKRGILAGGTDYQYSFPDPRTFSYIQPRLFGLNASKTF